MAEVEFIEDDPGQEYEVEELSSESGSEYGYASDVIEEIVSKMTPAEQDEYQRLKHFHTRQLVEQKKITPIHHMIEASMDEMKIPKKEVAAVLDEAAASTSTTAPGALKILADVPRPPEGKQIVTRIKASDDQFLKKYLNPTIKTEPELALFPSVPDIEIGDSEDDDEEEDEVRDAKSNIIHALAELEDLTMKQAKVYRKLQKDLKVVDAGDVLTFQQVADSLPGPSTKLEAPVVEYLESIDPRDARKAVSVGHLLMARYQSSKTGEKPPSVEDVANRYGISAKELHEVKRGEAYLGGKQKREAETTPSKRRKSSTPVKKEPTVILQKCDAPAAATEPTT